MSAPEKISCIEVITVKQLLLIPMTRQLPPTSTPSNTLDEIAAQHRQFFEPIFIQDIFITTNTNGTGEHPKYFKKPNTLNPPSSTTQRLNRHIDELFTYAENQHLSNNTNESTGDQKTEHHITRLSTHEFYFYTERPLSSDKLENIIGHALERAKRTTENVHLLLSSFAVKAGNELANLAIHITCGPSAKINCLCKGTPHENDLSYSNINSLARQNDDSNEETHPLSTALGIQNCETTPISTKSTFIINSQNTAFNQCVEICFDHACARAEKTLKKQLQSTSGKFIPPYISQLITSNSIRISHNELISSYVIQSDPKEVSFLDHTNGLSNRQKIPNNHFGSSVIYTNSLPRKRLGFIIESLDSLRRSKNRVYTETKYNISLSDEHLLNYAYNAISLSNWDTLNFLLSISPADLLITHSQKLLKHFQHLSLYSKVLVTRFVCIGMEKNIAIILNNISDDDIEVSQTLISREIPLPPTAMQIIVEKFARKLDYHWLNKLYLNSSFIEGTNQHVMLKNTFAPLVANLLLRHGSGFLRIVSKHKNIFNQTLDHVHENSYLIDHLSYTLNHRYHDYASGLEIILLSTPELFPTFLNLIFQHTRLTNAFVQALEITNTNGHSGLDLIINKLPSSMLQLTSSIPLNTTLGRYLIEAFETRNDFGPAHLHKIALTHPQVFVILLKCMSKHSQVALREIFGDLLFDWSSDEKTFFETVVVNFKTHLNYVIQATEIDTTFEKKFQEAIINAFSCNMESGLTIFWQNAAKEISKAMTLSIDPNTLIDRIYTEIKNRQIVASIHLEIITYILENTPVTQPANDSLTLTWCSLHKAKYIFENALTTRLQISSCNPLTPAIDTNHILPRAFREHELAHRQAHNRNILILEETNDAPVLTPSIDHSFRSTSSFFARRFRNRVAVASIARNDDDSSESATDQYSLFNLARN